MESERDLSIDSFHKGAETEAPPIFHYAECYLASFLLYVLFAVFTVCVIRELWLRLALLLPPLLILIIFPMLRVIVHRWIDRAVMHAIERYDQDYVGVDVTVEAVARDSGSNMIELYDLKVLNPPGRWKTPCVFHAGKLSIQLDVWEFIKSRGQIVIINQLIVKDAQLYYEKSMTSSNVSATLNLMNNTLYGPLQDSTDVAEPDDSEMQTADNEPLSSWFHLHKVFLEDVGMRVETNQFGIGMHIALGDIVCADFEEEYVYTNDTSGSIGLILLRSLFKTIIANAVGKGFSEWLM